MNIIKVIEKGVVSTLAVIEKEGTYCIAQLGNANNKVLKVWELPEEDIQQYVEDYICSTR